jgi:hypothetical protein
MGITTDKAKKLKEKFTELERKHFDTLFYSWRDEGESFGFDEHFLKLFMKIEEELIIAMQKDCEEQPILFLIVALFFKSTLRFFFNTSSHFDYL